MSKEKKTERIMIRISPELKAAANKKAEADGRTLSNYLEWLIKNDIREKE